MRNHSNVNEFDLHENGHVFESHFHMNGFAPRLVLKQRQRVTRKWPIVTWFGRNALVARVVCFSRLSKETHPCLQKGFCFILMMKIM